MMNCKLKIPISGIFVLQIDQVPLNNQCPNSPCFPILVVELQFRVHTFPNLGVFFLLTSYVFQKIIDPKLAPWIKYAKEKTVECTFSNRSKIGWLSCRYLFFYVHPELDGRTLPCTIFNTIIAIASDKKTFTIMLHPPIKE